MKGYDLVVVGAGVYGCWSALHATARGLKVALVDRGDIAGATSSCSTKLLHGGLRYLEQFEFSLVRKSLAERKEIKALLPHLFRPTSFWIPVRDHQPTAPWKLGLGLWIYEHLAQSRDVTPPSRRRSIHELNGVFPDLDFGNLDAAFSYGDGVTDDHRLALTVALTAVEKGCELFTYHEASFPSEDSVRLQSQGGKTFDLGTKATLLCTGRDLTDLPDLNHGLRLTQGTHLVLPGLGQEDALLLTSPLDQRKFFLVPWYGRTLLGTTDLPLESEEAARVRGEEVDYLLTSLKKTTGWDLKREDVLGSFVGVRVLQGGKNLKPSEISRGWACRSIAKKTWASIGGKYTSARIDALEMISLIFPETHPANHPLRGHDGLPPKDHLHGRYGVYAKDILTLARSDENLSALIFPDLQFIWAELVFSLREENVTHLVDLMRRRLPLTLLHPWDIEVAQKAADLAARELGWNEDRKKKELDALKVFWMGGNNLFQ